MSPWKKRIGGLVCTWQIPIDKVKLDYIGSPFLIAFLYRLFISTRIRTGSIKVGRMYLHFLSQSWNKRNVQTRESRPYVIQFNSEWLPSVVRQSH
jgi:hypothetical protein